MLPLSDFMIDFFLTFVLTYYFFPVLSSNEEINHLFKT